MKRNLRARSNRGFTIVELIVVVTVLGLLAALAVGAYNTVVNQAKTAKSQALVNTLSTAKSLFVADPATTEQNIQDYNAAQGDAQFTFIAKYIRVNGAIPATTADLLTFSGMPAAPGVIQINFGTVDDSTKGTPDSAPTVVGYP
jgi:prepilin-type N-terminal cleavage/methylation domain-containing protein